MHVLSIPRAYIELV